MSAMTSQITGVSIVYWTVCWGTHQRKHQSSTSLFYVRGIHRGQVNSSHEELVTRKMFPFDDVFMKCNQYSCKWYDPHHIWYQNIPSKHLYDIPSTEITVSSLFTWMFTVNILCLNYAFRLQLIERQSVQYPLDRLSFRCTPHRVWWSDTNSWHIEYSYYKSISCIYI